MLIVPFATLLGTLFLLAAFLRRESRSGSGKKAIFFRAFLTIVLVLAIDYLILQATAALALSSIPLGPG